MTWTAITSLGAVVVVYGSGVALVQPAIALAFAIAGPIVLVQDVLRFPPIACGKPLIAVVSDTVWVLCMLAVFVINIVGPPVSVEIAIFVWGLGGLISAGLLVVFGSLRPKSYRLLS